MPLLLEMFGVVWKERWKSDFTTFTTTDSCWTWIDARAWCLVAGFVLAGLDHLYPILKMERKRKTQSLRRSVI
jgi:hypothetical protein